MKQEEMLKELAEFIRTFLPLCGQLRESLSDDEKTRVDQREENWDQAGMLARFLVTYFDIAPKPESAEQLRAAVASPDDVVDRWLRELAAE